MRDQKGFTFWTLSLTIFCIVFVAVIGMKLVPAYIEYFELKKVLATLKSNGALKTTNKQEIKTAFDHASVVDDIKSVKSEDLEITADEAGNTTVSVEYQVLVPLVGNVSALLDFNASSEPVAETRE